MMTDTPPRFAVFGGSFSGNKGAASMTLAVLDGLEQHVGAHDVTVFSPYPDSDRRQEPGLTIVDYRPVDMLLRVLPAALLSLLSARRWRPRRGIAAEVARSDIAVDVSGISFMDGRGVVVLVYNCLLVLLPWAFGVPVVKVAQALGPFQQRLNRTAARLVLPRVAWIGARGARTADLAAALGLTNSEPAADVAFLLQFDESAQAWATEVVPGRDRTVLVMPSQVVADACRRDGIDDVAILSRIVDELLERGLDVVIAAHSAREGAPAGRTNDLPVCRALASRSPGARLLDQELSARQLRALIARSRLLVASRFHAMISGLATDTPTLVVGWSHKYREVLAAFGLDDLAVDFRELSDDALLGAVLDLDERRDDVRTRIADHLPAVEDAARLNLVRIADVLARSRSSS
jgi:colanic acid/amylovoran biosynthesis protein